MTSACGFATLRVARKMRRNSSLFRRMRPNIPSFCRIMAQETTEKKSRSRRTMRATKPVCLRMSRRSVTKIAVNRRMTYPSVETKFFLGVQNVAYASRARNKYDATVSESAAYRARDSLLTQDFESGAETRGELLRRTATPVVEKNHRGLSAEHVVVNGDDVELVRAKGFEYGCNFGLAHGDVTGDLRVGFVA